MSTDKAKKCFEDNLRKINAHDNPLEYNLNQGLAALAESIQELENKISELHQKLKLSSIIK